MQREIKIFGKNITIETRNEGDFIIAEELFRERQYRYCDQAIKEAKHCLIDIGGHLGFFSLYAGLMNPQVNIYTFEPHIGNFELLKQNLKNNNIRNVIPKQVAVGKTVGPFFLQISQEDLNHSTIRAIEPTGVTQPVQMTTLEKIFEKNRIEICDLLKMDCEGAEYEILYATPKNIFEKISHIFLEYHDWIEGQNSRDLKQFLEKMGFRVEKYPNHRMKELGFLWCGR